MRKYDLWSDAYNPTRIHKAGKPNQIVVWDKISLSDGQPLTDYAQPAFFTIKAVSEDGYVLTDSDGREFEVNFRIGSWLISIDMWIATAYQYLLKNSDHLRRVIEIKEGHLELLTGILIAQGFRVISDSQAKELGIKMPV